MTEKMEMEEINFENEGETINLFDEDKEDLKMMKGIQRKKKSVSGEKFEMEKKGVYSDKIDLSILQNQYLQPTLKPPNCVFTFAEFGDDIEPSVYYTEENKLDPKLVKDNLNTSVDLRNEISTNDEKFKENQIPNQLIPEDN